MIEQILNEWKPAETFEVPVGSGGEVWKFRSCQSYAEWKALERGARAEAQMAPLAGSTKSKAKPFSEFPYLPADVEEAVTAKIIQRLIISPELNERDCYALLQAPMLVQYLMNSIELHMKDARYVVLSRAIELEKKESENSEPKD